MIHRPFSLKYFSSQWDKRSLTRLSFLNAQHGTIIKSYLPPVPVICQLREHKSTTNKSQQAKDGVTPEGICSRLPSWSASSSGATVTCQVFTTVVWVACVGIYLLTSSFCNLNRHSKTQAQVELTLLYETIFAHQEEEMSGNLQRGAPVVRMNDSDYALYNNIFCSQFSWLFLSFPLSLTRSPASEPRPTQRQLLPFKSRQV